MNKTFSISPRIIAHLGEDLIRNESIALLELVKNSYDAYASNCDVHFNASQDGTIELISIKDDGIGMNLETVENVWLVIGTDNKKNVNTPEGGRAPLGEKGIGRLGVHKLGRIIRLVTKSNGCREVEVNIDWRKLKIASEIDDFTVEVKENIIPSVFSSETTGTLIEISNLKGEWKKRQLRSAYRDLTSLNSPFLNKTDSFNVQVSSNSNLFEGLPDLKQILNTGMYFAHCVFEGATINEFQYEFRPWSSLSKIDKGRVVDLESLSSEDKKLVGIEEKQGRYKPDYYDVDLRQYNIGPVSLDLVIFEKDRSVWEYLQTEKTSVEDYLRENGGIRVYRDNIRVYNYGERDNDWLGIDLQRIRRMGGNISNNIVIGSVGLSRSMSKGLREKTNREGFIEDEAYRAFVDAVNCALSIIVRLRSEDKERLITLYKKKRISEPVLSDLEQAICIVESKVKDESVKAEILTYLRRTNTQYIEVRDILLKSANAGLNMAKVVHELEKQIAALKGCVEKGDQSQLLTISKRLEEIVRQHTKMLRKSEIIATPLKDIIDSAVNGYSFRFSDHNIQLITDSISKHLKGQLSKAEAEGALVNLLDNSIFWLSYAQNKSNRKIAIWTTDEIDGYSSIVVADNGPGFNMGTDVAIKPFITGKPHNYGMGLGLHVVNEIMTALKGRLVFLSKNDINLPNDVQKNNIESAIIALCFVKA